MTKQHKEKEYYDPEDYLGNVLPTHFFLLLLSINDSASIRAIRVPLRVFSGVFFNPSFSLEI